ncbi:MAG TPA: YkyA family protein [Pseudogracilibacillus sp.]|nr:YkyA family protein [Pseudogracilibacillus sp.]
MKRLIIICSLMFVIFLTSCSNVKQMEKTFVEIHTLETEMNNIQEKVYALDEEEAEIYEEIITRGGIQGKEIGELANEAFLNLEEKSRYLKEEKEIFHAANEALKRIEKLNEKESDETVDEMIMLLQERYTYYDEIYNEQEKSVQLNEDLYKLLIKGANRNQIEEVLQDINEKEGVIQTNHEQFNLLTDKYNEVSLER